MRTYTVMRMVIKRYIYISFVKLFKHFLRFFYKISVPAVACPSQILRMGIAVCRFMLIALIIIDISPVVMMPVHIYNHYIERKIVLVIAVDNAENFLVRIRPPARIPRAENVFSRKRGFARNIKQRFKRLFVIFSV